jgi:predicted dienelactone hydrolase
MNIAIATLGVLMLAVTPALSVGFEQVMVPDPDGAPLEVGIWYPSDAPAAPQRLGLFEQTVAAKGAVAGRALPLIVMSHGTGGSFEGHYDTAHALAEAGFVVAAVTHTGDNYRDNSGFTRLDNRPRHIKVLIDYMLASWPRHDAIDPARIGMFGFSAGGFTTLVSIGGDPDLSVTAAFCAAHPDDWACRRIRETHAALPTTAPVWVHDRRIAAAVVAAPAVGYSFTPQRLAGITVPIQLWRGDSDEILPHPFHAQNVYDSLPVKPEYHVVPNAGHFAFLAPCNASLAVMVPEICHDPAGFDRAAFHREFNPAVVAFFKAHLPAH